MKHLHNNRTIALLLGLTVMPLAASCGQQKLVDLTINNPCNQNIWAKTSKISITIDAPSLNMHETSTFSYDNNKGTLPFDGLATDATVTVCTLDDKDQVTAAVTFGPKDMSQEDRLILNVAPGSVESFNVTTEIEDACGEMKFGRIGHTATALKDGRIFIVGGETINPDGTTSFITQTEFYDPATSKFTAGPELIGGARKNHVAILLNDGKVLIAGGIGQTGSLLTTVKTLYIYDPENNKFDWPENGGGYLGQARANMSATLLPNGSVLLAGGNDVSNSYFDNIEIWNPEKGLNAAGKLKNARAYHSALLLPDGSVAFIGGQDSSKALDDIEIYKNGSVDAATYHMNEARTMAKAIVVDNSNLLVTGGFSKPVNLEPTSKNFPVSLNTMELFNFKLGTAANCPEMMKSARAQHQITLLPEDNNGRQRFLLTGGRAENKLPTSAAEILTINNTSNTCSISSKQIDDMSFARANHVQAVLPGGDILYIGGQSSTSSMAKSAEYYTLPR